MTTFKNGVLAALVGALLLFSAACGGGASTPAPDPNPQPPQQQPAPPPVTGLSGQLTQADGARVSSAAGSGIQGATVAAMTAANGKVQGTQTLGTDGRFNFKSLHAGDYLVRVSFDGNVDLDGDGTADQIEILTPATVQGNSSSLNITLASADTDKDGKADSLQVVSDLSGSQGLRRHKLQRINFRQHEVVSDDNGDQNLENDTPDVDADHDCVPDHSSIDNSLHGGVIHGEISAIDDTSLTVNGVSFGITDATHWTAHGDRHADPALFVVGSNVLVRGLWNGTDWLALEVKLAGQDSNHGHHGHGGGGGNGGGNNDSQGRFGGAIVAESDTALTVGDNDFVVNADTVWKVRGEATSDLSLFDVGDIVLVKATFDGTNWIADEVRLILNLVKDGAGGGGGSVNISFEGTIEALGDGSVKVHDHVLGYNADTQWIFEDAPTTDLTLFDVGDEVKVDATVSGDSRVATRITMLVNNIPDEPGGPLTQTFSGDITAIDDTSIGVGDQVIGLTADTTWMADGAPTTDISLFDVGDGVEVDATSIDGGNTWAGVQVRLITNNVSDGATQETVDGTITGITLDTLSLGDQSFVINGETQWLGIGGIAGDISLFGLGDEVEVVAQQDGDSWVALSVTMLTDNTLGGT